jgi:uncharacterized protein (DUF58 family)
VSLFKRFLKRSKPSSDKPLKPVLNTGTHVSASQLIALQQQARKLDLNRQTYATASTTGTHRSRFRGRGMDYQESRIYQAGDDIRNMDWRVTARSGKPHTKLYQEERERPVVFLVDFNASMFFGSTQSLKSVVAAKVAAMLAWSVALKGDRIGALLINKVHHELVPKMGKRGALQLIRELVNFSDPHKGLATTDDSNQNNFNEELKRLRKLARPGTLIVLISDFYKINTETQHHLRRLSQHNDLLAVQVIDPLELLPPPPNRYIVADGSGKSGVLDTRSKNGKQNYQQFFTQHHHQVHELMRRQQIPLIQISTADDVTLSLQKYFGTKQRAAISNTTTVRQVA